MCSWCRGEGLHRRKIFIHQSSPSAAIADQRRKIQIQMQIQKEDKVFLLAWKNWILLHQAIAQSFESDPRQWLGEVVRELLVIRWKSAM